MALQTECNSNKYNSPESSLRSLGAILRQIQNKCIFTDTIFFINRQLNAFYTQLNSKKKKKQRLKSSV